MKSDIDLDIGRRSFSSGLLPELISVLRRSRPGDLIAVIGDDENVGLQLETWYRFTGNSLLETTANEAASGGYFVAGLLRWPKRTDPSDLDFGCTRTSTATCVATIVVCVPRLPHLAGNSGWHASSGSLAKRQNFA